METFVIKIKKEKDKLLLSALTDRLHLETVILSDEDKEDFGLLKAMLEAKKGDYVSKEIIMKSLHK